MAKIHITLVGEQTTPVYQGIIYANPDKVVYIYSDKSRENAELIKSEVKIDAEMRKIDPVDLNEIEKKVCLCFERYKNDEVSLNISSGTKPWAYYFTNIFSAHPNAMVLYIDQNGNLWNFVDKTSVAVPFDMDAQFRLRGNSLEDYNRFKDYTNEDVGAVSQIESLRTFNTNDFNFITDFFENHPEKTIVSNEKTGSSLTWYKETKSFDFFLRKNNGESQKYSLKSPHIRSLLLNAGWFEFKVSLLLSKWDKCKTLRMNCKFPSRDKTLKNEIDIIVDTGNKLLFVECKTQISKITDIDKFNSAVKNYGGMGSKALFVTDARMTETAKEKCKEYDIMTFSLQDNHLGLPVENALQLLLDSELFNINPI